MELMQASHQWSSRPADQRFTSLLDLRDHVHRQREASVARVMPNRRLYAAPVAEDDSQRALVIVERETGAPVNPTHWSFGQLAQVTGAPAGYLRKLPAPLAADCINHGLVTRDVEELGVLLRQQAQGIPELGAVTGPNYGRIWNAQVADSLVRTYGDGINGDFTVPGEFGKAVDVTRDNTTLYASDRDMFVFLADEKHRIELPDRRPGVPGSFARGFFVWNSEVGSATLGIATFLFDYVCCNRIVWGARDFKELRIRHTSGAPDRWIEQVTPALKRYADATASSVTQAIEDARAKKIGGKEQVAAFLNSRFTRSQAAAISLAHEAEEQRPIETLWDVAVGASAYARTIEYQDERVEIERKAGAVLDLAA